MKAANLLIDDDGTVLLGDLGVAADLSEGPSDILSSVSSSEVAERNSPLQQPNATPKGPKINKRKSFVGTVSISIYKYSSSMPPVPWSHGYIRSGVHILFHTHDEPFFFPTDESLYYQPCWMAPEIIQGKQYDSSADIWSFGITALELTQGRPPRSREPAQKVLLRTYVTFTRFQASTDLALQNPR